MSKTELTTMVIIQDKESGKVLAQNRIKSWNGLSFPGGHIENNESIYDCAIREVKEETRLDVFNLKFCGIFHWLNKKTSDRIIVFLYKTTDYTGELITTCNEGTNFWTTINEMQNTYSHNEMPKHYLPMFLENRYSEAFALWCDDEPYEVVYR